MPACFSQPHIIEIHLDELFGQEMLSLKIFIDIQKINIQEQSTNLQVSYLKDKKLADLLIIKK